MDETLRQVGELLLGSIPTIVFMVLLYGIYTVLVHKPLVKVLAERRSKTEGAVEKARADIAAAEARTAEYEQRTARSSHDGFQESGSTSSAGVAGTGCGRCRGAKQSPGPGRTGASGYRARQGGSTSRSCRPKAASWPRKSFELFCSPAQLRQVAADEIESSSKSPGVFCPGDLPVTCFRSLKRELRRLGRGTSLQRPISNREAAPARKPR